MTPPPQLGNREPLPFPQGTNLEWCVRMSLAANGMPNPYTIPIDDAVIQRITRVDCTSPLPYIPGVNDLPGMPDKSRTVKSLEGIEYLYNLETLIITGETLIDDLYELSALDNLTRLDIRNSNISDISPLAHTPRLTRLFLDNNSVTDLTPLANLRLAQLSMRRQAPDYIRDVSALAGMTTLTNIDLSSNKIANISAFEDSRLMYVNLRDNRIASIEPLRSVTTLITVDFSVNMIADLTPLSSSLATLQAVGVSQNHVTTLNFINGAMPSLSVLSVQGNMISDITPLALIDPRRTHGLSMDLSRNSIRNIDILRDMINDRRVRNLILSYNCIPEPENIGFLNDPYRLPTVFYPHQCVTAPPYDEDSLGDIVNRDIVLNSTWGAGGSGNTGTGGQAGTTAGGCSIGANSRTGLADILMILSLAMIFIIMRRINNI